VTSRHYAIVLAWFTVTERNIIIDSRTFFRCSRCRETAYH